MLESQSWVGILDDKKGGGMEIRAKEREDL